MWTHVCLHQKPPWKYKIVLATIGAHRRNKILIVWKLLKCDCCKNQFRSFTFLTFNCHKIKKKLNTHLKTVQNYWNKNHRKYILANQSYWKKNSKNWQNLRITIQFFTFSYLGLYFLNSLKIRLLLQTLCFLTLGFFCSGTTTSASWAGASSSSLTLLLLSLRLRARRLGAGPTVLERLLGLLLLTRFLFFLASKSISAMRAMMEFLLVDALVVRRRPRRRCSNSPMADRNLSAASTRMAKSSASKAAALGLVDLAGISGVDQNCDFSIQMSVEECHFVCIVASFIGRLLHCW